MVYDVNGKVKTHLIWGARGVEAMMGSKLGCRKEVLSSQRKKHRERKFQMSQGTVFQMVGAATAKLRKMANRHIN